MLKFKDYLKNEELTVGRHNDGNINGPAGAILPSVGTGSEQLPPHIPGLSSTDMIFRDLPTKTINGTILKIHKPTPSSPFVITIDTGNGVALQKIDFEQMRRWITGFSTIKEAIGKKISLVTQGNDAKGNLHIRSGNIT